MLATSIRRQLARLPLRGAALLSSASSTASTSEPFVAGDLYRGREGPASRSFVALIVNALRLGDRERASTLLSTLASIKDRPRTEDFGYILDFCARAPDPLFAMETWKHFEQNKIEVECRCWISIIQALCKGGFFNEAFGLLCTLGENHHSTISMYNSFLSECSRSGNWNQFNRCLQLMEAHLIGKSETTYRELLKFAVHEKCLSVVHEIYTEFRKKYELNIWSLNMFVWAFSKSGDLASACSILRDMVTLSTEKSNSVRSRGQSHAFQTFDVPIPQSGNNEDTENGRSCTLLAATERNILKASSKSVGNGLDILSIGSNIFCTEEADIKNAIGCQSELEWGLSPLLFPTINCTGVPRARMTLARSFNNVIHACAKVREGILAERLFLQMLHLGLEPSSSTYDGVVRAVIYTKGAPYAAKLVEEMKTKNLKPYNSTIEALSIGYSRILEVDCAELFLDQSIELSSRSIHPFNALLSSYVKLDKPEHGIHLLAKMKDSNIKPNSKTYELLFSLFGNVNAPYEEGNYSSQAMVVKRVRAIEMDMIRNGIEHTLFTLENLIRVLGLEGMMEEVLRYLSIAEGMFSDAYPGTLTYNIVLHALVEAKHYGIAIQIFNKMRSLKVPLDAATYNIMIDLCSNINFIRSAQSLISLMVRDGFLLSACTCSTLMKIVLAIGDFHEALTLLDQSLSFGLEADILFFNTILEEACFKGHLNIVELLIEKMHVEKIRPDPSTCSHVFAAYIDGGFHNTAMEALQVLSMRMISEEVGDLQDTKIMYESLLYSEDPNVESWIIDIFSKSNEHIGAALLNLRWCAITGYDISWSPDESQWARRLSARYGSRK